MSNFGQRQPDDSVESRDTSDSPKPHGDKMSGAVQGVAIGGRPPLDGGSTEASASRGSPKPHGDKLANAVRKTAKEHQPSR
jgi:hypothetical protein